MGSVRGQGLFLGIELVDNNNAPLEKQATYLVNRMKEHGVLLSTDGPAHNVIKIKPPLVFSKQNANQILYLLNKVFQEDLMKLN
jgi:4-aminobutyrate aminotransferase-like enzyme